MFEYKYNHQHDDITIYWWVQYVSTHKPGFVAFKIGYMNYKVYMYIVNQSYIIYKIIRELALLQKSSDSCKKLILRHTSTKIRLTLP